MLACTYLQYASYIIKEGEVQAQLVFTFFSIYCSHFELDWITSRESLTVYYNYFYINNHVLYI